MTSRDLFFWRPISSYMWWGNFLPRLSEKAPVFRPFPWSWSFSFDLSIGKKLRVLRVQLTEVPGQHALGGSELTFGG